MDAGFLAAERGARLRAVLVIAAAMSATYGVAAFVDLLRPQTADSEFEIEPVVGLLGDGMPVVLQVIFWSVLASWVAVLVLWGLRGKVFGHFSDVGLDSPRRQRMMLTMIAVLLLPYAIFPLTVIGQHLGVLLICLPSTAFGLWAVHRMQRYRRMPAWLPLAVFGWGAVFAAGFGATMNIWYLDYAPRYLFDAADRLRMLHTVNFGLALDAGVFEELGKAAGIAIVYLLWRRHIDGVVSGVVLGAAVGLGFNLVESIEYIGDASGGVAYFQYFMRQSLGLMAAHTAFSAVVGAGFGVARQLAEPKLRRIAIACGLFAGISGHFASDVVFPWFGRVSHDWFHADPAMGTVILPPLALAVMQGPLVGMCLLLLRRGLRTQADGLATELRAEARAGFGVVTEAEIPVLLRPARRFWLRVVMLRRYGLAGFRALGRLHQAQLDLAAHRWHRARGELDELAADEHVLRERVLRRRREVRTQLAREATR
ncbi:MAG: hypothetical protein AUI14_26605 [Actinobacteria bacterium 13_2_20CM_2_71_6]|nr:MAG: hypothetical protein AUI14_26605 [Actinobacteria bacterium 13_2_20CM_2_71_6]